MTRPLTTRTGNTFIGVNSRGQVVAAAIQFDDGLPENKDAALRQFCRAGAKEPIRTRKLTDEAAAAYVKEHGFAPIERAS